MKKVLYTNGCSHTHGTNIAMNNRLDLTWPNLLSNYLNYNLINDSQTGVSNDYIFRTTIEYILSTPVPPEKVVIQFTNPERFEINNHQLNPRAVEDVEIYPKQLSDFYKQFIPFYKTYFNLDKSQNQISLTHTHKLLNQIYSLEKIFFEHAIDDYTFLIWKNIDTEYITYKHLNKNKIIFNVDRRLIKKYERCKIINPRYNIPDNHYGADAHNEIFEWIKNHKYYGEVYTEPDDWINHVY